MGQVPGRTGSLLENKWIALVLVLTVVTACASSGSGLKTVYYNVPGTTAEQINAQISRRGPQNGHAIGTAETRMTPKVKTVRENGACRIETADVALKLIVTLPDFSDLNRADAKTRVAFEGLREHVEWHEQQHVEISQRYAKKIETELTQMQAQETCREAMDKARVRFKELFEEHNRAQEAFDESERKPIERRLRALGMIS